MRTRRKRLRLLGLLALLVVALGAAAVAGWLPPVNHWVERRLLAELRVLGVETSATHLRELSWRRAVVGPVELQLPGLSVRAEEARAELGWSVLAGRAAPEVVLRRLLLDATVDRLGELRGALQPQGGGFPLGRLVVENSRVVLRQGDRLLELPFSGFIDSRAAELRAEVSLTAPALSGRLMVRADPAADVFELDLRDGKVAPTPWRELLAALVPAELLALDTASAEAIQISGTATIGAGRLRAAKAEASLPALAWRSADQQADLAAVKLEFGAEVEGRWRLAARTAAMAWQRDELAAGLTDLDLVVEPGAAELRLGGGRAVLAGTELQVQGRAAARWSDSLAAATVEAALRIESVVRTDWSLAAPCELAVHWDGNTLALTAPTLALAQPQAVRLQALEASVVGLRTDHPALTARAQAAFAPLALFTVPKITMQPTQVAAQLSLTAGLARGQEGARLEWTVPQQRREFAWAGGKAEAAIGGEGLLNLDRNYVSGRATCELRALAAAGENWSTAAETATFTMRWPRLWLSAVRGWAGLAPERRQREFLWAGDYELTLSGGAGRWGRDLRLNGLELHGTSRGGELFETGGADLGVTVAEIADGPLRLSEGRVQATLGLSGGVVQGGFSVPALTVQPAFAQTFRWDDALVADGTFGFDPVVLTGDEPWSQWWSGLEGGKFTGGIGFRGRTHFAAGKWSTSAEVLLKDFGVAWPAQSIALERIDGTVALANLAALRSEPDQRLTLGRADLSGVALCNTALTFSLDGPGRVRVAEFTTEAFGGRLTTEAFAFDPRRPAPALKLRVAGARLEQLLQLFDDVPAEAEGLVDGELPLAWADGKLTMGTGFFQLTAGELGRVRFTRDLHLLTSGRSPNSLGYASILEVERSIQTLLFNRLRIDTYPTDAPGQSLRLRLVGTPAGGTVSTPVNLDVNVNAPLEHFLNWGRHPGPAAEPAR